MNMLDFTQRLAETLKLCGYSSNNFECTLLDHDFEMAKIVLRLYKVGEDENSITVLAYGYNIRYNKQNLISITKP